MTSLPIVTSQLALDPPAFLENEQFLLEAFRSFAEAAASLEHSYGTLRAEVERLHGELQQSKAGLEESLQENRKMRRHLDHIVDGLPCGVLVQESDGTFSRVNPEGLRLLRSIFGESIFGEPESASGSAATLTVPRNLCEFLERICLEPGEQEQPFEDKSGKQRWLAARHAALESAEGLMNDAGGAARPGAIFILHEISEAKRLLQEREKSRREQALAEMSAILAHEIRNPLGSMELFAGLLAEAGLSRECRAWVGNVQAGLRILAATVNNVLHFYSQPACERVAIEMGELLDWAEEFFLPLARQAKVQLRLRNRLKNVWFPADRHRLEQVLLNLVANALRAMPGGGRVEVGGQVVPRAEGAQIVISVIDTGPGIATDSTQRIFDAGFSTCSGSPGLGLAVCKKIVEQHGGCLTAANFAGGGAIFTFAFPTCTEEMVPKLEPHRKPRNEAAV